VLKGHFGVEWISQKPPLSPMWRTPLVWPEEGEDEKEDEEDEEDVGRVP